MSDIKTQFSVKTQIASICEDGSRYSAMDCLHVMRSADKSSASVYLTATDGRILAVNRTDGFLNIEQDSKPVAFSAPRKIAKRKRTKADTNVKLNGHWENNNGQFEESGLPNGRFPDVIGAVEPPESADGSNSVTLCVTLLRKLLDSVVDHNDEDQEIVLTVRNHEKPVFVRSGSNFGVIMPKGGNGKKADEFRSSAVIELQRLFSGYRSSWDACEDPKTPQTK